MIVTMRTLRLIPAALAICLLSCSSVEKAEAPHAYQMGERAPVGHLTYTVFERQWHTRVRSRA